MSKELEVLEKNQIDAIAAYMPEHKEMLQVIATNLPEIQRATSLFGKRQSQFMDNMLTVSHPTPLRNLQQILAECQQVKEALRTTYFKTAKKQVEMRIKQREFELEKDELKRELLSLEISEVMSDIEASNIYVSGAVRRITNYIAQYNAILASMGAKDFNEIDFEKEEERYHIMKAFEQALCAARTRGGVIDEGNFIYLQQIGVNGAAAQREVFEYMAMEGKCIVEGRQPTHEMTLGFLNKMADLFTGSAAKYAKAKGMQSILTESAAIQTGDVRLIEAAKT